MVNYVLNVYFEHNYSTFQNQILNNNMLMMAGNPTIVTVWNYNPILLLNKLLSNLTRMPLHILHIQYNFFLYEKPYYLSLKVKCKIIKYPLILFYKFNFIIYHFKYFPPYI